MNRRAHFMGHSLCCAAMMAVLLSLALIPGSVASSCGAAGESGDDFVSVHVSCQQPASGGEVSEAVEEGPASGDVAPAILEYRWHSPCLRFDPTDQAGEAPDCAIARMCPARAARSWQLWGLRADTRAWEYLSSECFAGLEPPTPAQTPKPQVTPGLVL